MICAPQIPPPLPPHAASGGKHCRAESNVRLVPCPSVTRRSLRAARRVPRTRAYLLAATLERVACAHERRARRGAPRGALPGAPPHRPAPPNRPLCLGALSMRSCDWPVPPFAQPVSRGEVDLATGGRGRLQTSLQGAAQNGSLIKHISFSLRNALVAHERKRRARAWLRVAPRGRDGGRRGSRGLRRGSSPRHGSRRRGATRRERRRVREPLCCGRRCASTCQRLAADCCRVVAPLRLRQPALRTPTSPTRA